MKPIFISIFTFIFFSIFAQNFEQKIFPNDPNTGVFFGRFVKLNNEFVFISAYQDFENSTASGSLYIYKNNENSYAQISKLFPDDGGVEEFFGYSLSTSDNWIITGAHHDSDFGASSGAAYILNKNETNNWEFYQKLLPFDASEADEFGKCVDIYQDFAISCSYLDDDNGINSGSVYIYKFSGEKWEYFDKIQASDPESYSQFGLSLDIYKNQIIVGAPFKNECGENCGTAYIFEKKNDKWIEVAKLIPSDLEEKDEFGIIVKIKENTAIVSSTKDDDNGINSGSVYVFTKENNKWCFSQKITPFDGDTRDAFGVDLDFNDSILVIGSYFDDDNGINSGSIYIFKKLNNKWNFTKKIIPSDGDESDAFGASISLEKDKLLVGAYSDDDNGFFSGAAYLFSMNKILTKTKDIKTINSTISIYPTIFNNTINIDFDKKQKVNIELYNINGYPVFTKKNMAKNHLEINATCINTGVYLLKINLGKKMEIHKIVKL
jgi:hypothetical protein